MSVSASTPSEMAAQSTFSYAQAAKGQGAAPSNTTPNTTAQDSEAPSTAVTAASDADQAKSADVPVTAEANDVRPAVSEKQDLESVQGSEGDAKSEPVQERRPESRRDEEVGKLDRPWRRNDKGTRSSSTTTRSDDQDSRRPRRGKKGKTSEKQSGDQPTADKEQETEPEPPKVELFEAPIPSVNIWHQRQSAQQAKPSPSTSETTVNGTTGQPAENKSSAKSTEEATSAPRDVPYVNGVKSQRKPEPTRPERNGPRGSRSADKDGKSTVLPAVEDAHSWPTPETSIEAAKEEKRKIERSDRSDKDSQEDGAGGQSKRQKEKWVTYDYVPTVSFETQLPQMRNSKPRGGARTGRESGPRASAESLPGKTTAAAPLNKSNGSSDRAREANGSHRAASQPPAAKRASLDNGREQKKTAGQSGSDKGKDATASALENGQTPQTRPEGRNDRGRGGFRGRGAHHTVNTQAQAQHQQPGPQAFGGPNTSRTHGHYSPPPRQGGHNQGQVYMPQTQRGRGGRNNNFHRMSLPNTSSRGPAVQPQFAPYDYNMAAMSAYPPAPYWDGMVVAMLKGQIEYYFSIENLCKDMYLRQRMDSQGFVPLHFVAAFKRIRDLSVDLNLIRAVCEDSAVIEYVVGEDDGERLRSRESWQKFVLPMADRDELARNDGPAQLTYKNRTYGFAPQFNGIPPMAYGMPAAAYPANPADPAFQQYIDTNGFEHVGDGAINGNGVTQLSAEVPDFSPSTSVTFGQDAEALNGNKLEAGSELTNGHVETPLTNGLTNGVHVQEQSATQS